jgi:hypothetical protein
MAGRKIPGQLSANELFRLTLYAVSSIRRAPGVEFHSTKVGLTPPRHGSSLPSLADFRRTGRPTFSASDVARIFRLRTAVTDEYINKYAFLQ